MAATVTPTKVFSDRISRIEISATLAVVNEAEKLRSSGVDLVDFGAGEPHFTTPQHIKDAGVAAIQGNFTRYTAVGGIAELRDAIAARHARDFGTHYKRDEVVATVGGKQALFNAIQALVDHGDEVIIPVPYWVSFKDIVQYAGAIPVFVQTDERRAFEITAEMVERAFSPRTKAIILNSPNNPSGAVMNPDHIKAIVRLAHQRGIYVIADECYVYLDYTGRRFSAGSVEDAGMHVVIIGSLSKTYSMTGWRLGYALAPAPIIGAMQKLQSQSTSNSVSFVQKGAVAALTGSQDCLSEMLAEYRQLRDRMIAGLRAIPGIQCTLPQGAFYAYPNISAFLGKGGLNSAADVARKLLNEAHVVTVPGEAFGTPDHMRLSYATAMKDMERGLDRMVQFFADL